MTGSWIKDATQYTHTQLNMMNPRTKIFFLKDMITYAPVNALTVILELPAVPLAPSAGLYLPCV